MVRSIIAVIVSYIAMFALNLLGFVGLYAIVGPKHAFKPRLYVASNRWFVDGSGGHDCVGHHRRAHLRGDCAWTQSNFGFGGANHRRRVIAGDSGAREEQGKRRSGSRGRRFHEGGDGKGLLAGLGAVRISVCQRGGRGDRWQVKEAELKRTPPGALTLSGKCTPGGVRTKEKRRA